MIPFLPQDAGFVVSARDFTTNPNDPLSKKLFGKSFGDDQEGMISEALDIMIEEVTKVLQLTYPEFWEQVPPDDDLRVFLDSFLCFTRRNFDLYEDSESNQLRLLFANDEKEETLKKLVLLLYLRLFTREDKDIPKWQWLSKETHASKIWEYWMLDIPKIIDLLVIYSPSNPEHIVQIVNAAINLETIGDGSYSYRSDEQLGLGVVLTYLRSSIEYIVKQFAGDASKTGEIPSTAASYAKSLQDLMRTLFRIIQNIPNVAEEFKSLGFLEQSIHFFEVVIPLISKQISANESEEDVIEGILDDARVWMLRFIHKLLDELYFKHIDGRSKNLSPEILNARASEFTAFLMDLKNLVDYNNLMYKHTISLRKYQDKYPTKKFFVAYNRQWPLIYFLEEMRQKGFCETEIEQLMDWMDFTPLEATSKTANRDWREHKFANNEHKEKEPEPLVQGVAIISNDEKIREILNIFSEWGREFAKAVLENANYVLEIAIDNAVNNNLPSHLANVVDRKNWNKSEGVEEELYKTFLQTTGRVDRSVGDIKTEEVVNSGIDEWEKNLRLERIAWQEMEENQCENDNGWDPYNDDVDEWNQNAFAVERTNPELEKPISDIGSIGMMSFQKSFRPAKLSGQSRVDRQKEEPENLPSISELNSASGKRLKKKWKKKKKKELEEGEDHDPQDVRFEKNRSQDVRVQFEGKNVKPLLPPKKQQKFHGGQTRNNQPGGDSKPRNHNNYKNNRQSGSGSGGQNFRGGSSRPNPRGGSRAVSQSARTDASSEGKESKPRAGPSGAKTQRNRKYRDRNKSRFANHNRKKQNAKKRQMPL